MKLFFQIFVFFLVIFFSVYIENPTINLTYLLFYYMLFLFDFFFKKSELRYYYNCFVFGSLILLLLFQLDHGTFWNGPDDELFYLAAIGKEKEGFYLLNIRWQGYYFLLTNFYIFIKDVIDSSVHFYHGILLSSFYSAFIPYFFRKHLYTRLPAQTMKKIIILLLILPQFVLYNSTYLRDSLILLFFSMLMYFIHLKNIRLFYRVSIISIILLITFSIRPASFLFLLIYLLLFVYFNLKKGKYSLIIILLISFSLLLSYLDFRNPFSVNESYINLSNNEGAKKSIGNILLNSTNVLAYPVKFFYMLFSPIPPSIVFKFSAKNVIFTIGDFIKYYYTFLFLISSFNLLFSKIKEKYIYMNLIYVTLITTVVLLTTREPRHLSFLFPLIFIEGLTYNKENKLIGKKIFLLTLIAFPVIFAGYITIKYIY